MLVQWNRDLELEIVESYDAAHDGVDSTPEIFRKGTIVEFDVFGYGEKFVDGDFRKDENFLNVQFGNGSVAFGVSREWFTELK